MTPEFRRLVSLPGTMAGRVSYGLARNRRHDMSTTSNWNAIMQYSFLRVFANDGTSTCRRTGNAREASPEDGIVDDREREVLACIFERVNAETVSPEVWQEITQFKSRYQIP